MWQEMRKIKLSSSESEERDSFLPPPKIGGDKEKYMAEEDLESLNFEDEDVFSYSDYEEKESNSVSFFRKCFPCFFNSEKTCRSDGMYSKSEYGCIYDDTELSDLSRGSDYFPSLNRVSAEPEDDSDPENARDLLPEDSSKEDVSKEDDFRVIEKEDSFRISPPIMKETVKIIVKDLRIVESSESEESEESEEEKEEIEINRNNENDFISLSEVDITILKEGLELFGKEITKYKTYHNSFQTTYNRIKNADNQRRLDNVKKMKNWLENLYKQITDFVLKIEKNRKNNEFYLAIPSKISDKTLGTFFESYVLKYQNFLNSSHPTKFMTDLGEQCSKPEDGWFRILPTIEILPEIIHLKNNHQKK